MKMIVISIPLPPTLGTMLAIARFQVPLQGAVDFRADLEAVKAIDKKSFGIFPRSFESCRQRILFATRFISFLT